MAALFPRLVAAQLARPHGLLAKKAMDLLDAGNAERIAASVEQARVRAGMSAADVGFGGGAGLRILLDRVAPPVDGDSAPSGAVHGVERSTSAIRRARRRFRAEIREGRLAVHEGRLQALPLPDAGLDALISTNTVYFVPDLAPVRDELARVPAPGCRVVLGLADPERKREIGMTPHGLVLAPVDQVEELVNSTSTL